MKNRSNAVLGVFLLVFAVYAFVAGGHYGGDALNNYLTTESIVLDRDLAIYDRPFEVEEMNTSGEQGVTGSDGRQYSPYGIGMALLQVPLFLAGMAVSFLLKNLPQGYITFFCVSFTNVFLSAANAALLLVLALKLGVKLKDAMLLCLVYAFSTMAFVYSGAGFPEPALVTFMLIAVIALFSYTKEEKGIWYLFISGAALGAMAIIKVYTVILAPAFVVYLLAAAGRKRMKVLAFILAFCAVWSIDLGVNFLRSGNILMSGYGHVLTRAQYGHRFCKGLYYYWFSSGKGFFFYNLPVILGLFSWGAAREKNRREFYFILSLILIFTAFFAYFFKRGSLFSWGPRYLFPVIPLLAVLAGGLLEKKAYSRIFLALAAAGSLIQLPAVLTHYPSYINFAVKGLGVEEYMINFIPDLTPIKGTWAILLSVISTAVTGHGISLTFNPDAMFVEPVSASLNGYAMSDIWWINLLKVYPGMLYVVIAGILALAGIFVLGAVKLKRT